MMDNAEEVMHLLEEFSKLKPKIIPRELDDYLGYVAKTGNPVFKWSLVKSLFREKMLNVINDFYEDTLTIDLPPCPNVDAFNYDRMKSCLLERLETFHGAPFTVQRICELLTNPRKEYNRADKFMRAIEKNVLVVSTREPGRYSELDCETTQECSVNGVEETNNALDTSFPCNDLGPGPDSSSQSSEVIDHIDINQHNNVNRITESEQDVSNDSDEVLQESNTVTQDEPLVEKIDSNETEANLSDEEVDESNVSSTKISSIVSPDVSNSASSEEVSENSNESISTTQDYPISSEIPEGISSKEDTLPIVEESTSISEELEPCIISEVTAENEANFTPDVEITATSETEEPSESLREETNEVKELEVTPQVEPMPQVEPIPKVEPIQQISEPMSETVEQVQAVECDTSEGEQEVKFVENIISEASSDSNDNDASSDSNDQVITCDTIDSTPSQSENMNTDAEEVSASDRDQFNLHKSESSEPMEVDECQTEEKGEQ